MSGELEVLSVFSEVFDSGDREVPDEEERLAVADPIGLESIEFSEEWETDIIQRYRCVDFDRFLGLRIPSLALEEGFYLGFKCLKIFFSDRESGGLAVSAVSEEVVLAGVEELDDIDVLGAAAARDELISLVLERDRGLAEGFSQTSRDESDNPVLDGSRVIEEDQTVSIDDLQGVINKILGRGLALGVERLEFSEDRVELILSSQEHRECLVG